MRSSLIFTVMCATMAMASPILQKKALVTNVVTDYVYVYVTEGAAAPKAAKVTRTRPAIAPAPVVVTTSVKAAVTTVRTTSVKAAVTTVAAVENIVHTTATAKPTAASTTPSTGSGSGTCPDASSATDYASTVLYHHNIHRCNHSAPALTYNAEIAGYAATLAATCNFHHDLSIGGVSYGQNIADFMGSGFDVQALGASSQVASSITNMWYNGELGEYPSSAYGQANPDFSNADAWDHFSQIVWKGTKSVGCATQYCPSGALAAGWEGWFTVCNYQEAGNMGGEYGTNVLPPLGHKGVSA